MTHPTIEIDALSRQFGRTQALDNVSLKIEPGTVFGLIGENGAGKTTLIRHLLGMFRARSGSVRVFGLDPVLDPVGVLSRTGFLSEDRDLPDWQSIAQFINYTGAFYPQWESAYANELVRDFDLNPDQKIKSLSRGQRARVALIGALGHRPDLLLLDEPSSGLDPAVRRDILESIVRAVADRGSTVVFSSHLLDEVERVADTVGFLHHGRLILEGSLDTLKAQHLRLNVLLPEPATAPPRIPEALSIRGEGRDWSVTVRGDTAAARNTLGTLQAVIISEETPSLEEIFMATTQKNAPPAGKA